MPEFTCSVCGSAFKVPDSALAKYPGWEPRYCREHSPKRNDAAGGKKKVARSRAVAKRELDHTLEDVISRYHEGPDTGVFTDGGSKPNPGPGGWGVVHVIDGQIITQKHGHRKETTNNRMELTALIEGYKLLPLDAAITVYSDSNLCVQTINEWAPAWQRRGWKRKTGAIKNLDLVKTLYALHVERPGVELVWIEAHAGWLWNEYADALATAWRRGVL